eukprot:CAMPEP_0206614540 /NCGR_PEP_ID=MMETSP0325_2-20121206/57463_1 /ASSEMBLY_ACC=CAM_ASM_000347 /TAXON_ID=2866 /ORGANISM="Crypthecodinium cohnii, Strain Seligo" /LENGTH=113 /DNA_ID=CAMNT_0054135077 /DNA_START=70 /DNA_END=408 /DNA_ORIENTATION=-
MGHFSQQRDDCRDRFSGRSSKFGSESRKWGLVPPLKKQRATARQLWSMGEVGDSDSNLWSWLGHEGQDRDFGRMWGPPQKSTFCDDRRDSDPLPPPTSLSGRPLETSEMERVA